MVALCQGNEAAVVPTLPSSCLACAVLFLCCWSLAQVRDSSVDGGVDAVHARPPPHREAVWLLLLLLR